MQSAVDTAPATKSAGKEDRGANAMKGALQALKTMIVNGELSPGEQIRQEEMAEQLSVSRVPLREALNVLADQGLLFHRPHQGYFVTKRAPGENAQIRRMLHLLENELMVTIRWPDQACIDGLRQLNEQMRAAVKANDVPQLIQLNREFHFRIFSLSPNTLIIEEVRRLWSMIEPLMWSKFDHADGRKRTLVEHDRVIVALASRDRSRCVSEMVHHRYSQESGLPIELPGAGADADADDPTN